MGSQSHVIAKGIIADRGWRPVVSDPSAGRPAVSATRPAGDGARGDRTDAPALRTF